MKYTKRIGTLFLAGVIGLGIYSCDKGSEPVDEPLSRPSVVETVNEPSVEKKVEIQYKPEGFWVESGPRGDSVELSHRDYILELMKDSVDVYYDTLERFVYNETSPDHSAFVSLDDEDCDGTVDRIYSRNGILVRHCYSDYSLFEPKCSKEELEDANQFLKEEKEKLGYDEKVREFKKRFPEKERVKF